MAASKHSQSAIALQMQRRRKALRMSCQSLALRSGVSLPTIHRILRGGGERTTYANLTAVARALGMSFELKSTCDEQTLAERQAQAKAEIIARMVQGTSARESQAADSDTYQHLVRQTWHELMAGPRRRLWRPLLL
jgi:transcriptional regulator with XRE-family HTH domain